MVSRCYRPDARSLFINRPIVPPYSLNFSLYKRTLSNSYSQDWSWMVFFYKLWVQNARSQREIPERCGRTKEHRPSKLCMIVEYINYGFRFNKCIGRSLTCCVPLGSPCGAPIKINVPFPESSITCPRSPQCRSPFSSLPQRRLIEIDR
jgi:hypothetical protein